MYNFGVVEVNNKQSCYYLLGVELRNIYNGGKMSSELMKKICESCISPEVDQKRTDLLKLLHEEYSVVKNVCDNCKRRV